MNSATAACFSKISISVESSKPHKLQESNSCGEKAQYSETVITLFFILNNKAMKGEGGAK